MFKLLNLEESPDTAAPGDLRLWQALEKILPRIKFMHFRVIVMEWADGVNLSELDLGKWHEILGVDGLLSVAPFDDFGVTSLQRRRLGEESSDLEIIVNELLVGESFPQPLELWEADQFEISAAASPELVFENVNNLLKLGSKTGLFDPKYEEIRIIKPGMNPSWTRKREMSENLKKMKLDQLLETWKQSSLGQEGPNPIHKNYFIKEQMARMPESVRSEKSLLDQIEEFQESRFSFEAEKLKKEIFQKSPLDFRLILNKNINETSHLNETQKFISLQTTLSDSSIGKFFWTEDSLTRKLPSSIWNFPSSPTFKTPAGDYKLWALKPISKHTAIVWRRLKSLLNLSQDWFQGEFKIVSGEENWLKFFKRHVSMHKGWEITENSLRKLFQFESIRTASHQLLYFYSNWNPEKIHEMLRAYGIETIDLGKMIEEVDALRILKADVGVHDVSWLDLFTHEELSSSEFKTDHFHWNAPELKSPTYGYEKIAIFPDQFLLKVLNYGSLGEIDRNTRWQYQSDTQSREIQMRHPANKPVGSHRWLGTGQKNYADGFGVGQNVGDTNPKEAVRWAMDGALRELVARGVDPSSNLLLRAEILRPQFTKISEKDTQAFASFVLGVESLLASMKQIKNIFLQELKIESTAPVGHDYVMNPRIQISGEVAKNFNSAFTGFRMSGEILYAVGPRPAFMDVGSRILKHVRIVSNHVSQIVWTEQLEMYQVIHQCLVDQVITGIRPVGWGGIVEELAEMSMWSGIGVQLKPSLSTFELFSGAPGRFVVGVLPQEAKNFERLVKAEWVTPLGTSSGEKLFGLPIDNYRESRLGPKK